MSQITDNHIKELADYGNQYLSIIDELAPNNSHIENAKDLILLAIDSLNMGIIESSTKISNQ